MAFFRALLHRARTTSANCYFKINAQWRHYQSPNKGQNTTNIKETSLLKAVTAQDGIILAFGDSLTHGTFIQQRNQNYYTGVHPYSIRLEALLKGDAKVVTRGYLGAKSNALIDHLKSDIKASSADLVIILGGSNDVYVGRSAERITKNLLALHELALDSSVARKKQVYTVAVTIPQVSEMFIPDMYSAEEIRLEVNDGLRTFAQNNRDRVALLDLESAFEQEQPENLLTYWSTDRVHLSSDGYDAVGQMLYELISTHSIAKERGGIDGVI